MNRELEPQAVQHSPDYWGINNDYNVLTDVLLGKPEYFKWVEAGPLIGRTLRNMHKTGIKFDFDLAQRQHAEMVRIYEEEAGVTCHYLDSDPVLHRNFFARDSSAMTPWGFSPEGVPPMVTAWAPSTVMPRMPVAAAR